MQHLKDQKFTCKLFIEASEEHLTVRAYEDILKSTVDLEKFTCEDLVGAAMKYEYHIVTSISRLYELSISLYKCAN